MNKKCFRVIFSKTLQRLVVTSELAKSEGKSTESSAFGLSQIFAQIRPLTFSLYCALGFVAFSDSALANLIIQADKSAPKNQQPIVLQTANGLPQVNIQTPNDKGLSHNKYSKFDVDTKGAILNNSRTNVQTQQGGWVQGNPYLAKGEAKVILNEVNSSDPSVLKGYVEVAGKKADVIIANPSGLHCEGCGIINSDRATLTTGKPQIKNGHLDSFVVEKGKVKVSGKGLDNSRVDYTEVIARETEVNAGIWSKKEAKVVTGKNTVKRSDNPNDLQIIHTNQPLATESQPQFAIDVGELGGMYSGKIHLIGTEHGVGVRNAGHIGAGADTLHIDSQGRIVNKGTLNAHHAVQLTGSKGIENQGKIENRQGNITLNTASDIQQDGSVVARGGHIHQTANQAIHQQGETVAKGDITYTAPSVTASTSSLIAAGVEVKDSAQGEVRTLEPQSAQGKSITVTTTGKTTLQGKNVASGNINVSSSEADLDHSQTSAYSANFHVSHGDIQANNATLTVNSTLNLTTPTVISTQGSELTASAWQINAHQINNQSGKWLGLGRSTLSLDLAGGLNNTKGLIQHQGDISLNAHRAIINNHQGTLHSLAGNIAIQAQSRFENEKGNLIAFKDLVLQHEGVNNQAGNIMALTGNATLQLQNHVLNNQQGTIAAQHTVFSASQLLNQEGIVDVARDAKMTFSEGLDNSKVSEKGSLIQVGRDFMLHSPWVRNTQTKSTHEQKTQGMIANTLTLSADNLDNQQGGIYVSQGLLAVGKQLNNQAGQLFSAGDLQVKGDGLSISNQQGEIIAADNLEVKAEQLSSFGTIEANHTTLDLAQGFTSHTDIKGKQRLTITTQGEFINHAGLLSQGELTLNAKHIENRADAKISANHIALTAQTHLTNRGLINAAGENIIKVATTLHNLGTGRIYGDHIALQADTLINEDEKIHDTLNSAVIAARQQLDIGAKHIYNQQLKLDPKQSTSVGVTLSSEGNMAFGSHLNAQHHAEGEATQLRNTSALIDAGGNLQLNIAQVENNNHYIHNVMTEKSRTPIHETFLISGNTLRTGERINFELLKWISFSRAGKVAYKNHTRKPEDPNDINTHLLPLPNEEVCSNPREGTGCVPAPKSLYLPDDPIWTYFHIEPPTGAPPVPDLSQLDPDLDAPPKPQEPRRKRMRESQEAYEARLKLYEENKAAYEQALKEYEAEKADYEANIQPYLDWVEQNEAKFKQLEEAIINHNAPLLGRTFTDFWINEVKERVIKEDVATDSVPAQILVGGHLHFSGNLTNNQSTILAGGAIRNTQNAAQTVENNDQWGERVIEDYGTEQWTYSRWRGGVKRYHQRKWGGKHDYMHETRIDIPLNIVRTEANSLYQSIAAAPTLNSGAVTVNRINVDANPLPHTTPMEIRSVGADSRLPSSSLYRIQAAPQSRVLIETDPAFADYRQWLSGDYMFTALRSEHENVHKRLGDGYYEQRLVREQINLLTGRMFSGDHTDLEQQYKALMDEGISFAQKFNLRVGIALTPAQVAQLTSDIVWFEPTIVTLADGSQQTVLAPKVYVLARKGDIDGKGTLLSGNQIHLNQLSALTNQGTIYGRNVAQLNATTLQNQGKISGGITELNANVLKNMGGVIEGEHAVRLTANELLSQSTTKSTQVNLSDYSRTQTNLNRQALIHTKGTNGTLSINADHLTAIGSVIRNEGTGLTEINANDIQLKALSVGFDEKLGRGDHYRNQGLQDVVINHVQGKGNVVISGKNIYTEGTALEAAERLAVVAENSLVLDTAKVQSHYEEYHKDKRRSAVGSSSRENFRQERESSHLSASLQGKTVDVLAGNAKFIATQVAAKNDISVKTQQDMTFDVAENHLSVTEWEKRKKSGLTFEKSGGSARIGVGASKAGMNNDTQTTSVIGTDLAALNGNLTVVAGGNLTANAVNLESGKDLHLQGKNVTLNAAVETQDSQHSSYAKSAGMGIGITYNPVATFKQAYGEQSGQGSAGSIVGKAITAGEALDKTSHKIMQSVSPYWSAKSSKSSTNQHQETAVVSQLNAGGNLSITATEGDITTQGALLSAKGDGNLWAKEEVTLGVATSRSAQDSHSSRKGVDIELSRRPTDVVGLYLGKDLGDGESETQHASILSFGGNSNITAEKGNITLVGTQLVSEGDNRLTAGENIRITTAVDRTNQRERNTFHGWGEAVVSETERFAGYNRRLSSQSGEEVTHKGATVASLGGNTTISAGKDFHQTSGQILAKNYASIDAQNVTFDTVHNNAESQSKQSDLKVGMFARVSSPVIDLIQAVESTVKDKEASDRVKAAQLVGAAAKGYSDAVNVATGGALFRAEAGVGFSHSRQRQESKAEISQGNTVNAKHIEITARSGNLEATHTDFTSRDREGKRLTDSSVSLNAAKGITLEAGESREQAKGKQQSSGVEVGVGASAGAQTGVYVYGQAGFSNGKQNETHTTYQNSRVDTEKLSLNSGGNATLKGFTGKAHTIHTDIKGDLRIESLQDVHQSSSSSGGMGMRAQVSLGTAGGASGYGNFSNGKANSKQVTEQSGLFAGEGGYHINANNVHLEGGAIASTNPSQSELSTNTLTFKDIQNESSSEAVSAGISGSANLNNVIGVEAKTEAQAKHQGDIAKLHGIPQSNSVMPGIPMHDNSHDSTVTKATLTEGNITLNKDSQPTQTTAKALGINTDITQANEQVETPKDINKVLKEQQILSQAAGNVAAAVMTYTSQQAAELEAKAKQAEQEAAKAAKEGDLVTATQKAQEATAYQQAAKEWQTGGSKKQAATAVAAALSLIVAGKPTEAVVAGAASPYVNEAIKKATDNPELQALNIPAHILWGAVEAQLSGGSATAGAVAAGVGEVGAKILSETVYGKSPTELTETEKQELIQVIKGIAGVAGGVAAGSDTPAGSLATVSAGMTVAENAVEFNGLLDTQVSHLFKDLEKAEKEGKSLEEIFTEYKQLSDKQFKDIQENCNSATCLYGIEKLNEEANQKALELVSFFNSKLSTLSDSTQERFVEFVIEENAKELDFINGARTPAEKAIVFLVDAFVESRESQGLNVSPKIAGFAKKNNKKVISTNEKPNNLSPIGAGRQGAFNEAKRQSGIPTSQQPSNVYPNVDKRGNRQPGLMYEFEIPQPGGGIKKVIIRDDAKGHFYGEGDIQNRGPHFNDPKGNHYDY